MKERVINISIRTKKFTKKVIKRFMAYTLADFEGANSIEIVIDKRHSTDWELPDILFHEFTHAYVRMSKKRNISVDDEEKLAQIIGKAVRGIMEGFTDGERVAKVNRDYAEKLLCGKDK